MSVRLFPDSAETGSEVDFREVWGILRRQWWVLAGCGLLGIVAAAVLFPRPEPVYESSALIRVEEQRGALSVLEVGGQSHLETEMQVIQSRTVVGAVVDSLQLQVRVKAPAGLAREAIARVIVPSDAVPGTYHFTRADGGRFRVYDVDSGAEAPLGEFGSGESVPLNGTTLVLSEGAAAHETLEVQIRSREQAINALAGSMVVTRPTRNADIIRISYRDADPLMARDIVNTIVDRFLLLRDDAQKTEVRSTIDFLTGQIESISQELAAAEDELRSFRERAYVIDPTVEGSTQVQRLAELQADRSSLEAERVALQALVEEIEETATRAAVVDPQVGGVSPYRRLAAFPSLMQSEAFSDILRSLSSLENERANLVTRRRPEDQDVQVLSMRIAELEEQLKVFVSTYLAGLSSQVASIEATLMEFGDQLARLPANEVEFARLSRQPKLLGDMHALLQTRLQEAQVAQAVEDASVRIVDPAVVPQSSVTSARWAVSFGAVSMLGLLLGVVIGFVREYADSSVYTRSDVQVAIGVPVLGLIPRVKGKGFGVKAIAGPRSPGSGGGLLGTGGNGAGDAATAIVHRDIDPGSPLAMLVREDGPNPVSDAYDRLHANILFALVDNEPKTLLLTSPLPGDGKTTTATNLSVALARRGLKTLLIDADLRRGQVNTVFKGNRAPGLTEVLAGTVPVSAAMQTVQVDRESRLHYLASGEFPTHPATLVGSPQMTKLMETLEGHFDRIVIDSPPVNIVADAAILARYADGVIVVARAGVTPQEALTLAAEQLSQARIQVVGAVLNDIDFDRHGSYDPAYKSYSYGKKYYTANV